MEIEVQRAVRFSIDEDAHKLIYAWAKTRVPPVSFSAAARHILSVGINVVKQDEPPEALEEYVRDHDEEMIKHIQELKSKALRGKS